DVAEYERSALGIIDRRMRLRGIPFEAGCLHRLVQDGLAVRQPGQRCRIETAEKMKRTLLVTGAADRGIEEADIECGVMSDQDRALAFVFAQRLADRLENHIERLALLDRGAKRVGRVDAGDLQRTRVDV